MERSQKKDCGVSGMINRPQITEAYIEAAYSMAVKKPHLFPDSNVPVLYAIQIPAEPRTSEGILRASSLSKSRLRVKSCIIQPTMPGWSK